MLAVSKLSFGEGNNREWKAFGSTWDGVTSTAASTGLCQLNSGAAPDTPYPDGNNGIDNSFGKNLGKPLGLCGTPELTQLETLVKQASDIMADGTQDPTQVCDGISVGFGFEMKPPRSASSGRRRRPR